MVAIKSYKLFEEKNGTPARVREWDQSRQLTGRSSKAIPVKKT